MCTNPLNGRASPGIERQRGGSGSNLNESIAQPRDKNNLFQAVGYIVNVPGTVRFKRGHWKHLDLQGVTRALVLCPYCGKWHLHGAPDPDHPGLSRVSHCAPGGGEYRLVLKENYQGQVLEGSYR